MLDGALVVIDGTRGVEPQTVTVWNQLKKFNIPKLVFINKFDRENRNLKKCLESISTAFAVEPLLLNECNYNSSNELIGISEYFETNLNLQLVETLALYDDVMEQKYCNDVTEDISKGDIMNCMKRLLSQADSVVPVCVGSGYTGIGIPFVLDTITALLPTSDDVLQRLPPQLQQNTCGVVFKSTYDRQKGIICQSRLYSGDVRRGDRLYNTRTKSVGIVNSMYRIKGGEISDLDSFDAGEIALLTGCKEFRTGDVFINEVSPKENETLVQVCRTATMLNCAIQFSQPLFFCKIEPRSISNQSRLETALKMMCFEDPTIRAKVNNNGEVILGGTGQLHLNVIKDRLNQEYGLDCFLRSIRVAYKETVVDEFTQRFYDHNLSLNGSLSVLPSTSDQLISVNCEHPISEELRQQIRRSLRNFFTIGPLIGLPLSNVNVNLDIETFDESAKESELFACLKRHVRKSFQNNKNLLALSEPYAKVVVSGPQLAADHIISDFVSRIGSSEYDVTFSEEKEFSLCGFAPLSKLTNYSSELVFCHLHTLNSWL